MQELTRLFNTFTAPAPSLTIRPHEASDSIECHISLEVPGDRPSQDHSIGLCSIASADRQTPASIQPMTTPPVIFDERFKLLTSIWAPSFADLINMSDCLRRIRLARSVGTSLLESSSPTTASTDLAVHRQTPLLLHDRKVKHTMANNDSATGLLSEAANFSMPAFQVGPPQACMAADTTGSPCGVNDADIKHQSVKTRRHNPTNLWCILDQHEGCAQSGSKKDGRSDSALVPLADIAELDSREIEAPVSRQHCSTPLPSYWHDSAVYLLPMPDDATADCLNELLVWENPEGLPARITQTTEVGSQPVAQMPPLQCEVGLGSATDHGIIVSDFSKNRNNVRNIGSQTDTPSMTDNQATSPMTSDAEHDSGIEIPPDAADDWQHVVHPLGRAGRQSDVVLLFNASQPDSEDWWLCPSADEPSTENEITSKAWSKEWSSDFD